MMAGRQDSGCRGEQVYPAGSASLLGVPGVCGRFRYLPLLLVEPAGRCACVLWPVRRRLCVAGVACPSRTALAAFQVFRASVPGHLPFGDGSA